MNETREVKKPFSRIPLFTAWHAAELVTFVESKHKSDVYALLNRD